MQLSKHNDYPRSTQRSFVPTDGRWENKQMNDVAPFPARLDAALAMNGMDNAAFAAHFGQNGQQLINGWRRRGRIGIHSLPKARALLPRTNMVWLQEGTGEPEQFSGVAESSRNYDPQQSYAPRLDMHTLAAAVRVMAVEEGQNGKFSPLKYATTLMGFYERLVRGEQQVDLIDEVLQAHSQGNDNAEHDKNSGAGRR